MSSSFILQHSAVILPDYPCRLMRSLLLIFSTVVVLVAGFCVYAYFQPTRAARPSKTLSPNFSATTRPQLDKSFKGLGSGEKGWVYRYNAQGELASQFRGEHYEPQKDGTVDVVKPQADFFLSGNGVPQKLRIEGATGNVVMDVPAEDKPGKIGLENTRTGAPSRGRL